MLPFDLVDSRLLLLLFDNLRPIYDFVRLRLNLKKLLMRIAFFYHFLQLIKMLVVNFYLKFVFA
jgi:hypothetical protein